LLALPLVKIQLANTAVAFERTPQLPRHADYVFAGHALSFEIFVKRQTGCDLAWLLMALLGSKTPVLVMRFLLLKERATAPQAFAEGGELIPHFTAYSRASSNKPPFHPASEKYLRASVAAASCQPTPAFKSASSAPSSRNKSPSSG